MKKICFITQCALPIPTVKGGAVETLVEYLLDENEIDKNLKFTVYSIADKEAKKISKKYNIKSILLGAAIVGMIAFNIINYFVIASAF